MRCDSEKLWAVGVCIINITKTILWGHILILNVKLWHDSNIIIQAQAICDYICQIRWSDFCVSYVH